MSIFDDDTLTQGQRLVWFAVQELATNGVAVNNCAKIAGHMDSSRSHVSRALQTLHGAGWLTRDEDVIQVHDRPKDRASHTRNRASQARNRDSDTRNRASHTRDRDSQARSDVSPQGKKKKNQKEKTQPSFVSDHDDNRAREGDGHWKGVPTLDDDPFGFLDERQRRHIDRIEQAYEWVTSPDDPTRVSGRAEKMARRLLSGPKNNRKKVPTSGISQQVRDHPLPAVIAAWVLAETKDSPFEYAQALLTDGDSLPFYESSCKESGQSDEDEWLNNLAEG